MDEDGVWVVSSDEEPRREDQKPRLSEMGAARAPETQRAINADFIKRREKKWFVRKSATASVVLKQSGSLTNQPVTAASQGLTRPIVGSSVGKCWPIEKA